jgi:hypothetical protein
LRFHPYADARERGEAGFEFWAVGAGYAFGLSAEVGHYQTLRRGPNGIGGCCTCHRLLLDADVVAHFRHSGPGWQSRINEELRKAAGL